MKNIAEEFMKSIVIAYYDLMGKKRLEEIGRLIEEYNHHALKALTKKS